MKHHIHTYILIGIMILAAWIRLHQSSVYIPFWQEQVDDLLSVRQVWKDLTTGNFHHLSAKGQTGTYRWSLIKMRVILSIMGSHIIIFCCLRLLFPILIRTVWFYF